MLKKILNSVIFFYIFIFIILELAAKNNFYSTNLIPAPSSVLVVYMNQSEIFLNASLDFLYAVSSFVLAGIFAFTLAIMLHRFNYLQKILTPITLFFQTVPIIAIAPLLVIYLGFGLPTIFSATLIVCFFPIFAATLIGLRQVSINHLELLKFYKANPFQKLLYLEIPSSLPTLLAGLKTSAGLSIVGVVSAEFIVGGGLGGLIDSARLQQRVDIVFAALILLSLIGLFIMKSSELTFRLLFKKYLVKS